MKEKIFDDREHGPFKAKVDERFHKLGQDCPDDGWATGYLYRDLHNGEVLPHIYNCPCRWIVQEETIEPIGFHIAQWIKVTDRLPEYGEDVLVAYKTKQCGDVGFRMGHRVRWRFATTDKNDFALFIGEEMVTHWQEIVPPKED